MDNTTTTYPEGWAFPELSRKELELFTLKRNTQVKELLAACEYALSRSEGKGGGIEIGEKLLRQAIAKAKGV